MLIVIAIIGILAAVLIPNLLGAHQRAYDTAAMSCARSIGLAAEDLRIDSATSSYAALDTAKVLAFDPKSCSTASLGGATGSTFTAVGTATDFTGTTKHALGKRTYTIKQAGVTNDAP